MSCLTIDLTNRHIIGGMNQRKKLKINSLLNKCHLYKLIYIKIKIGGVVEIFGWVIWGLVFTINAAMTLNIPRYIKKAKGIQKGTVLMLVGCWLSLAYTLFANVSKLHLIWLIPVVILACSIISFTIGWQKGKSN